MEVVTIKGVHERAALLGRDGHGKDGGTEKSRRAGL